MDIQDFGIATLVGALLPIIIAIVVQTEWSKPAKAVVSFVLCLIGAAISSYFSGDVRLTDPDWDWVVWFGVIYAAAMTMYARFYRPTNVAPAIEQRTNLRSTPR